MPLTYVPWFYLKVIFLVFFFLLMENIKAVKVRKWLSFLSREERPLLQKKNSSVIGIYLSVRKDESPRRENWKFTWSGPHHRYINSPSEASLYLGWTSKIIGMSVHRDVCPVFEAGVKKKWKEGLKRLCLFISRLKKVKTNTFIH